MAMHESYTELFDRIESNSGLVFVNTFEETKLIRELTKNFNNDNIQFWSATQGLHQIDQEISKVEPYSFNPDNAKKNSKGAPTVGNILTAFDVIETECKDKIDSNTEEFKRTIYVLRDADKMFVNPMVVRKIRDIVYLCATAGSPIVICGPAMKVPTELEKDSVYIELGLPTRDEIKDNIIVKSIQKLIKLHNKDVIDAADKIDENFDMNKIVNACMGLTEDEIFNACNYSLETKKALDEDVIIQEKKNIINKNDILKFWPCDGALDTVGGFDNFKNWFKVQKAVLDNPELATSYHAEPPKGCMLLGVQGSGKTAIAKAAAKEWGKGVIKLDMGNVFAGLVGESEKRMRLALATAEAAGGVIIIDEIDKGLAGAGSSDKTDGGTTKRVIGTLLTWMQEAHPGVFVIATANDITAIRNSHPELLRKGRFDNIFFSDIPTQEEREAIFKIHLKKRGRNPDSFDVTELAKIKYKDETGKDFEYTGAEIEHGVKEAIQYNLALNLSTNTEIKISGTHDITTEDVAARIRDIIPIVKVGDKHIQTMRDWAKNNAVNVSSRLADVKETKKKTTTKKINLKTADLDLD